MSLPVKLILKDENVKIPEYKTKGSAGFDLAYHGTDTIYIAPKERKLVPTGLYMAIEEGFELQIRPRSGVSLNTDLVILNSPGTIDSDYRGEICIIVGNRGSQGNIVINPGDRIAQGVFNKIEQATWDVVTTLDETDRGANGFGHTGIK